MNGFSVAVGRRSQNQDLFPTESLDTLPIAIVFYLPKQKYAEVRVEQMFYQERIG